MGLRHRPDQQEVALDAPGGTQRVVMSGDFFLRLVRTLTAPVVPGLVTRTVILAPGRRVVRKGVSETEPARVLRNVLFRGQPLPEHVATSVAPDGTPATARRVMRVDLAVAWAKKASVIVSFGGGAVVAPGEPEAPEEPPAEPPPAGEP